MIDERTERGREFLLKPRGLLRFVPASFLLVWLCGWVVGEAAAIAFLATGAYCLLTGAPPAPGRDPIPLGPALAVGAFLIAWLAIWTIGGIGAIREVLRLLVARDRVIAG